MSWVFAAGHTAKAGSELQLMADRCLSLEPVLDVLDGLFEKQHSMMAYNCLLYYQFARSVFCHGILESSCLLFNNLH